MKILLGSALLGTSLFLLMYRRDMRYKDSKIQMRFFKISEFDSPDKPGSGELMHTTTLQMLDEARARAGVPFHINSGFRTSAHNKKVGGVSNSAHMDGYAADIRITAQTGKTIYNALKSVGFARFGLYKNFIHVDNDPSKPAATWVKGGEFLLQ